MACIGCKTSANFSTRSKNKKVVEVVTIEKESLPYLFCDDGKKE